MKRLVLLLVVVLAIGGCARLKTQGDFAGSLFGLTSSEGDWVIISQSGGRIMDVWLVRDSIVANAEGSDGWIFTDGNGVSTAIGGDVKVLRIQNPAMFEDYHEYHMEFETKTYRELYGTY